MSLKQFLLVMSSRSRSVALVWLLVTLAVAAVSLLRTPLFTAEASVVLDIKSTDPIAGIALPSTITTTSYMATQMGVVQSERVRLRAIDALGLSKDNTLRQEWKDNTSEKGDFRSWIAEELQRHIDVVPTKDANILTVAYTSPDPDLAAAVANALVKAYIDTTLDLRVEPARAYNNFFDVNAKQLRRDLEQSQAKLAEYQRSNGVLLSTDRLDVEMLKLSELSTQLVALQGQLAESTSRQGFAEGNAESMQEVLSNPLIVELRGELSRQESRVSELSSRVGSGHPQLIEAQANLNQMRSRIQAETKRVASGVAINNSVNKNRVAQLRADVETQRARILKLKSQQDEASLMVRDVESAQRVYDAMLARASQTGFESQATQTNVSVLKDATPPAAPSSPRILLNTLVGFLGGGLLAIGIAILREATDRRLRSDVDVTMSLRTAMLGTLPRIPSVIRSGQVRLRLSGDAPAHGTKPAN